MNKFGSKKVYIKDIFLKIGVWLPQNSQNRRDFFFKYLFDWESIFTCLNTLYMDKEYSSIAK